MRNRFALILLAASLFLVSWSTTVLGQAGAPSLSASPQSLEFSNHTIGTLTPLTLTVVNGSDKAISPSLKIVGEKTEDTPSEFGASSKCLNSIPAKQSCDITVTFAPVIIAKEGAEKRSATLVLSDDSGEPLKVGLEGNAFQTVTVSPNLLEFEAQFGNTVNVQRTVEVTNYTSSALSGILVTATGDFTESHAGCAGPINPGGSCAVGVSFTPKLVGEASGSLTITANSASVGQIPRVVSLRGKALVRCKIPPFSWHDLLRDPTFLIVMAICGFYFLGLVLVRWHMIAKPARQQIVAEVEVVRSRAIAETAWLADTPEIQQRLERIHVLLDQSLYPFKSKRFPTNLHWQGRKAADDTAETDPKYFYGPTRFFNALFWSRGHELASWTLAHEAEVQLADLLSLERVRARLESAEQELRKIETPLAISMADRVHESLAAGDAQLLDRARQLLQQLEGLLKPQSVQEAALDLWLADLRRRVNEVLQTFGEWVQKSASPSTGLDECKARLQDLITNINSLEAIKSDLAQIPTTDNSNPTAASLQAATGFLSKLAAAIADAQAKLSNTMLETCNATVSALTALGADAVKTASALKAVSAPDQVKAYESLASLCKSQSNLIGDLTQATVPNPRVTLLVDILAALQQQKEYLQKITQADATAVSADLGNYRQVILQLASVAPLSSELLGKISSVLLGEVPAPLGRWRALLHEALDIIFESVDEGYFQLMSWHNKMIWLVGCALLFIFVLAASLGNPVLLLVGAVGGLMSRLTRTTSAAETKDDSGATWGSLFLSPLTGAFCAWGGILLVILGVKLNVLGVALNLDWCNPYDPTALAIALLFGFMERLFDTLTAQIQDKLTKTPAPAAASTMPTPASPAPKITNLSPTSAVLGKEVAITVTGSNFQKGATASLTRDTGEPDPAKKLDYNGSTSIVVTCVPMGAKAFSATLTVTNPDKQSDTSKLNVTAS